MTSLSLVAILFMCLALPGARSQNNNFCIERPNGLYPDPEDCGRFYQCSNFITYSTNCQPGLVFNPEFNYCDWPRNVDCTITTIRPTTEPPTTEPPTTGQPTTESSTTEPPTTEPPTTEPPTTRPPTTEPTTTEPPTTEPPEQSTTESPTTIITTTPPNTECRRIVCRYPNWGIYRAGMGVNFGPHNINASLCTHIIYDYAMITNNAIDNTDPNDEPSQNNVGIYARVTLLKATNPSLKVLLSVGGINVGSQNFSDMAFSASTRNAFVTSTIPFLRARNFDGLDIDWEYPNRRPEDRENFALLLKELREEFENENVPYGESPLLLTATVSSQKDIIDEYLVSNISSSVDFLNLLTLDLHGPWERYTGHVSPLRRGSWEMYGSSRFSNVEWVANYWAGLGVSRDKLVIGIPTYARTFTLWHPSVTFVGALSVGFGRPGPYTGQRGFLSYYEVCLFRNIGQNYFIDDQRVPYLVYENQWVGYENIQSVTEKVSFTRIEGFGGVMIRDLSTDDFEGSFCGEGAFPLISAINNQCYQ